MTSKIAASLGQILLPLSVLLVASLDEASGITAYDLRSSLSNALRFLVESLKSANL